MHNEFNSKETVRKLDLCGQVQREEVRKHEAEYQAGFNSAFAGGHRRIDLQKLAERDPAMAFFLTRNRTPESA